jgi:drug/metabolite transporter (DMT)-like permease
MKSERMGIALMAAQQVLFTLETIAIHQLSGKLSVMQIALLRSIGGLALVACLIPSAGWSALPTSQPRVQVLRAAISIGYLWIFAFSFTAIPFADATALSYTTAIYITLLALPILGEVVGWRRYAAAVVGMGGAMLIVKPGFTQVSWLYAGILLGTALNALALILTKYMQRQDHPVAVMLYVNGLSLIAFLPGIAHPWPAVFDPWFLGILVLGPIGVYCGILAVRRADAATLAPYGYVRLVLASIGAFLIFREPPDWLSISGAAIILAACLMGSWTKSPLGDTTRETVPADASRV